MWKENDNHDEDAYRRVVRQSTFGTCDQILLSHTHSHAINFVSFDDERDTVSCAVVLLKFNLQIIDGKTVVRCIALARRHTHTHRCKEHTTLANVDSVPRREIAQVQQQWHERDARHESEIVEQQTATKQKSTKWQIPTQAIHWSHWSAQHTWTLCVFHIHRLLLRFSIRTSRRPKGSTYGVTSIYAMTTEMCIRFGKQSEQLMECLHSHR